MIKRKRKRLTIKHDVNNFLLINQFKNRKTDVVKVLQRSDVDRD